METNGTTSAVEVVGPQQAEKYLATQTENFRRRDKSRVAKYATAMANEEWPFTGEPIIFDADGHLIDGQHRLAAIIQSGASLQFLVVRGVKRTSAKYMDRGRPRTNAQWLAHEGIKNAFLVAAIARWRVAHVNGMWSQQSLGTDKMADGDVLAIAIAEDQRHQDAIKLARKQSLMAGSVLAAILSEGTKDNFDLPSSSLVAQAFADGLADGIGLEKGEPVLTLRERLITEKGRSASQNLLRGLATLAWNKHANGETAKTLKLQLWRVSEDGTRVRRKSGFPNLIASAEE